MNKLEDEEMKNREKLIMGKERRRYGKKPLANI
jgi:hypothetical protein